MKATFDAGVLVSAVKTINNMYAGFKGTTVQDSPVNCIMTAFKNENSTNNAGTIVVEFGDNGFYAKMPIPATVEDPGKVVLLSPILAALPKKLHIEFEYTEGSRFRYKSVRYDDKKKAYVSAGSKGELDVAQDQNFSLDPINEISLTHTIQSSLLKDALRKVLFKASNEKNAGAMNQALTCTFRIQGKRLSVFSNDVYCAALYSSKVFATSQEAVDLVLARDFLEAAAEGFGSQVGFGCNQFGFRFCSEHLDVVHPSIQYESADVAQTVLETRQAKSIAEFDISAEKTNELLSDVLHLAKADQKSDPDLTASIKKDKSLVRFLLESSVGKSEAQMKVTNLVVKGDVNFACSGKLLMQFLSFFKHAQATVSVYDSLLLIEDKANGTVYIMPTKQ